MTSRLMQNDAQSVTGKPYFQGDSEAYWNQIVVENDEGQECFEAGPSCGAVHRVAKVPMSELIAINPDIAGDRAEE